MNLSTQEHPSHDRLRSALRGAVGELHIQTPGPETVRSTADHRARRQQRVTAGIASVAVVAGGIGIAGLANREPGLELQPGASGSSPSGITFTWSDGEHVLSQQPEVVQGPDGVLYALSTAPGATYEDAGGEPVPQALYRSTDGIIWEPTELGTDLQLASLDIREDGVLYGLSTAPGTAALRVATSADAGASWQLEDLPAGSPEPAVAEDIELASGGSQTDIATAGGTIVVTAHRQWYVQPQGLVSAEEEDYSWLVPTEEGLQVHVDGQQGEGRERAPTPAPSDISTPLMSTPVAAPTPLPTPPAATGASEAESGGVPIVRTIPWAEVGLEGPEDLLITDTWTVVDGGEWTPVTLPVDGVTAEVEVTAEGFVAILHAPGSMPEQSTPVWVARSADGLDWTLDEVAMGEATYVAEAGTIGDRVVIASVSVTTAPDYVETFRVSSSGDAGRTWTTTDLTGLLAVEDEASAFVGARDIGPLGMAAAVSAVEPESGEQLATALLYSPDGVGWDVIPAEELHPGSEGVAWLSVDADRIIASVFQAGPVQRTVVGVPTR